MAFDCHWRSILPNETESWPLPRIAAATTTAATTTAAAAHKEGSPW